MKKTFLIIALFLNFAAYSITLDELTEPKSFLGRISNTDKVEVESVKEIKTELPSEKESDAEITAIKKEDKELESAKSIENTESVEEIVSNFADLNLKRIAKDVLDEISTDEIKINSDLSILWTAVLEKSETMKYTIYKLSNPDEDKPADSVVKKILKPIANISTLAGASVAGDPYMATGALIGGGLINAFMKDDKEANYTFSKVSDADMVLLVRKIDTLQKKLLELYVDYKTKEELMNLTRETFEKREENFKNSQDKSKEELVILDVYYRNAKSNYQKAQDEFLTSRAILENLVGKEALLKIE